MKKNKPNLVVFEGLDGCGKSTIGEMTAGLYRWHDRPAVWLSSSSFDDYTRDLKGLLMEHVEYLDKSTRSFLFISMFQRLWATKIIPLLRNGHTVLLDRDHISNFVYCRDGTKTGNVDYELIKSTLLAVIDNQIKNSGVEVNRTYVYLKSSLNTRLMSMTNRDILNSLDDESVDMNELWLNYYEQELEDCVARGDVVFKIPNNVPYADPATLARIIYNRINYYPEFKVVPHGNNTIKRILFRGETV